MANKQDKITWKVERNYRNLYSSKICVQTIIQRHITPAEHSASLNHPQKGGNPNGSN